MELQHVNAKIFVDGELTVDPERFIPVFHEWIREQTMEELLIDVADYRHVPAGPGVVLVALEADYSIDNTDHRPGLRYNRKAPLEGSNEDRFRQALRAAVRACTLLEEHFADDGPLKFSRREFELFINDRAMAPNTPETYAAWKSELRPFLAKMLGHQAFSLEVARPHCGHDPDPRRRLGVTIQVAEPVDWPALLTVLQDSDNAS